MVTDRSILEQTLKSSGSVRQTSTAPCHSWGTMRAFDRSNARRSWWKNELAQALEIKRTLIHSNQSSLVSCREGGKETGEIEYAADTALDHMAVMDENESPVEVHLRKI